MFFIVLYANAQQQASILQKMSGYTCMQEEYVHTEMHTYAHRYITKYLHTFL